MTAEDFLKQRYEVCKGREQKWQLDDMYRFAKEALCFARNEEREKAIDAFKQLQCYGGKDMDCYYCSCRCNLGKFKKLINK